MGKKKPIRRGRDVTKLLRKNGCEYRQGRGSHMVGTLPDGNKVVYYHGEISKGVRSKVQKALAAAGLLGLIAGALLIMA